MSVKTLFIYEGETLCNLYQTSKGKIPYLIYHIDIKLTYTNTAYRISAIIYLNNYLTKPDPLSLENFMILQMLHRILT